MPELILLAITILIIIVGLYLWYRPVASKPAPAPVVATTAVAPSEGMKEHMHGSGCRCARCYVSPEAMAVSNSIGYFDSKTFTEDAVVDSNNASISQYTAGTFNDSDNSYNDLLAQTELDKTVHENHKEFVRDMPRYGAIMTGPTMAFAGDGLGYGTNWIGIRGRPKNVDVGNPTQLTGSEDIDYVGSNQNPFRRSLLDDTCLKCHNN